MLKEQLINVLQGSVRKILAANSLEEIMQERSSLGQQFTNEVTEQIKEWGVIPVKTIEFMDIRDMGGEEVIANIMAKEKSRIEKESRITVAENTKLAELQEIDAKQIIELKQQEADQMIGARSAEKDRLVGIAKQQTEQSIAEQANITAEKKMQVERTTQVKQAEIEKETCTVNAERDKEILIITTEARKKSEILVAETKKETSSLIAEGDLEIATKHADGIALEGTAKGSADKSVLMAPVESQIALANEIGANKSYQEYLINIHKIDADKEVGIAMASALQASQLKIIANSGDIQSGIGKLTGMFSSSGGTNIGGMLSALANSDEGKALIDKFLSSKTTDQE